MGLFKVNNQHVDEYIWEEAITSILGEYICINCRLVLGLVSKNTIHTQIFSRRADRPSAGQEIPIAIIEALVEW